ncbi:MAG: hypothetical protein PUP92_12855 [Rhizonema sp. PD38]|nr:hypothetical protein [Rhizonema sp. PD38]
MIIIERPDIADGQQFIQWTANHQSAALALPPAAMHLWQYLLRKNPAGVPIEIDLNEELETISAGRARPYSLRSLKDALTKHLASSKNNLVEIIKDYGKSTFKVIAHHAGPVKEVIKRFGNFSPKAEAKFHNRKEISMLEASNPDSAVPLTESLERSTAPAAEIKNFLPKNQELDDREGNNLEKQTEQEQSEFVDKSKAEPFKSINPSPTSNETDSFSNLDLHEDNFSDAEENENLNNKARSSADFAKKQPVDPEELRQALAEVRTIECTPNFRMNVEIQNAIANNLQNVYAAVAYVKEQIRLGITIKKSCEAMFMWALRTELDSKYDRFEVIEYKQPSEKDKADMAIALSNGAIKEFSLQPNGLWVVDTGKECLAWYKFFEIF